MKLPNLFVRPLAAALLPLALAASHVAQAADSPPQISLKLLADGLAAPTALVAPDDGSHRLFVSVQAGLIYVLDPSGKRLEKPLLDLRERMITLNQGMDERGITCIALHPKFASNHKFYVLYNAPKRDTAPADWNNTMRVSEFRVSDQDPSVASLDSERILLQIDKPDWNHNSGRAAFGPDGFLYLTLGDGGAPNDVGTRGHAPEGNGQHLQTLLGKILRIDVDHGNPYAVPSDNPFVNDPKGLPEIYAYGIRNPWGISFDRGGNHDLIVADVGQDRWEELNIIVKGGNYGWRVREGFDGFDPNNPENPPANPPKTDFLGKPFIDPVFVYRTMRRNLGGAQSFGTAITGGYVYRGKAFPQLVGKYVFGDWASNFALGDGTLIVATRPEQHTPGERWTAEPLATKGHPNGRVKAYVWALGEDTEGELYVLTSGANMPGGARGKVWKLVPE
jgi:glucose/arabinose dehydrogenase